MGEAKLHTPIICLKGKGLNFISWFWSYFFSLGIWVMWPRVLQSPQLSLGSRRIKSILIWAIFQGSSQNTALYSLLPHVIKKHSIYSIMPRTWVSPESSSAYHPPTLTLICKVSWFHFEFLFLLPLPPITHHPVAGWPLTWLIWIVTVASWLVSHLQSHHVLHCFFIHCSQGVQKYRTQDGGLELKLVVFSYY